MSSKEIYGFINDVVFKFVFGQRKDKRILICLVNALLKLKGMQRIRDIEIINPFNNREFIQGKESIVDICAEDEEGRLYNIEVQVAPDQGYIQRILFYAGKLYCRQLCKNELYEELKKTISISIVDFTLFKNREDLHNIFRLKNTHTNEDLTDIFELHFVELAKFRKDKPANLRTSFEIAFFLDRLIVFCHEDTKTQR